MIRIVTIVAVIMLGVAVSWAQTTDDQGAANDPQTNDRANACYDGGTLADKCDNDWAWQCGWYLIRHEAGLVSRDEFPLWCSILLPTLTASFPATDIMGAGFVPTGPASPPVGGCIQALAGFYVDFSGGYSLPANTFGFSDSACSAPVATKLGLNTVYAPPAYDASALCVVAFGQPTAGYGTYMNDLYECFS